MTTTDTTETWDSCPGCYAVFTPDGTICPECARSLTTPGVDVVNTTPHAIEVLAEDGTVIATFPPAWRPARVRPERNAPKALVTRQGTLPIVTERYGRVIDLPSPAIGVRLIVSRAVAAALPERDDLIVPTDLVRDESGRVIGCRALGVVVQ